MDAIQFRVPAAADLGGICGADKDHAGYLCDTLHRKLLTRQVDRRGFTRLQREHLTRFIPKQRLTPIREALEEDGVIHVDRSYSVGAHSIGYRLDPRHWRSRSMTCRNEALIQRIREYREDRERRLLPVHKWLRSKFRRLRFDHELAREIIATMRPKPNDKGYITTDHNYHTLLHEVCGRFKRRTNVDVDPFGRVHTGITNLPAKLRKCLSVRGQPLIGIDLVSSQPLVAGIVAQRYMESKYVRTRMLHRRFDGRTAPYITQEVAAIRSQANPEGKAYRGSGQPEREGGPEAGHPEGGSQPE